ncbi:hypothetical protein J1N35_010597 [Gossypium stocksii]|uniref:Uncharacterized protein n=1 Tax=Gossypium stocksii TaxID=47602 RepID=A0A9D4AC72_9ROSI|nr:hypothetical protein J1N35_010597 [Gossypium stocksii]
MRTTLTKLEDQMSQLISMMGDIKRKEQVKAIALCSSKVLSSPNNLTLEEDEEDVGDPKKETPQGDDSKVEPETIVELVEKVLQKVR